MIIVKNYEMSDSRKHNLYEGKVYEHFKDFQKDLDEFCKNTFTILTCYTSKKHEKEELGYYYITYRCEYFRDPENIKSRGNNIRPVQKYKASACRVIVRISLCQKKSHRNFNKLVVKEFYEDHEERHICNKESFEHHIKNRGLNEEEKQKVILMMKTDSTSSKVAEVMSEETGKLVSTKDVQNIFGNFKNPNKQAQTSEDQMNLLKKVITKQIEIDKADNFAIGHDNDKKNIYVLFYQNDSMKEL